MIAPFLETGDVEYTEFTDENGFLQESSPYEGQPSPELEKRWDDLWRRMVPTLCLPRLRAQDFQDAGCLVSDFDLPSPKYTFPRGAHGVSQ